ncbi:hypothetical protein AB0D11_41620 [Streptomyces monashensis]|uniref:hypothetical protein n=1 Tax=Streptomyces monashensis TaxID=1678012 RepID=UPI0033F065E6
MAEPATDIPTGSFNGSMLQEASMSSDAHAPYPASGEASGDTSADPPAPAASQDPAPTPATGTAPHTAAETAAVSTAAVTPPATAAGDARAPATAGASSASAHVHADSNYGTMIGQLFEAVQRHSGAPLSLQWVQHELENYVPVKNETELAELLNRNRVVVLIADRLGSGRWTAALQLLSTVEGESLTLRRVRRETGDSFSTEGLKGRKRTGWILDLRGTEESLPASCDFGLELRQSGDLIADDSYLVVLASTHLWKRIGHGASDLARTPEPPEAGELFTRYLQSAGIDDPQSWVEDHRLGHKLPERPGQIREWARTLAQAEFQYRAATGRSTEQGSVGFEEVVKAVTNAVSGWMDVLTKWHSAPGRTSYDRNYLLLAAVCDGAAVDNVHEKITSLARAFKEKEEGSTRPTGQQGPGLIQLAHQIEAEPLPDGTLRFAGPAFAEAVVRYFWRDRPELIDEFTQWTAKLCLELKPAQRTQLAQRMAPWALHHAQAARSTRLLHLIAEDWAQDDTLAPHARDLLVTAMLDPEIGQLTWNATNRWAEHRDSSPRLLQTLSRVYQTLAPVHPERMLRRLGGLALKDGAADTVGEAINALWSNDELRPQVRDTLDQWFTSDHTMLQRSASSAFMYLTLQQDQAGAPALLGTCPSTPPDWVIRGWRTALESDEPTLLARRASAVWLDAAASRPDTTEQITTTLVRAVHDTPSDHLRGQRFLNLVRLAERWLVQTEPADQERRNRFHTQLMHRAQLADPRRLRDQRHGEPAGE